MPLILETAKKLSEYPL